jgi:hypothetical protein
VQTAAEVVSQDHQMIGRWSGSRLALEGRRGALYVFAAGDRSSVTGEVKVGWANGSQKSMTGSRPPPELRLIAAMSITRAAKGPQMPVIKNGDSSRASARQPPLALLEWRNRTSIAANRTAIRYRMRAVPAVSQTLIPCKSAISGL